MKTIGAAADKVGRERPLAAALISKPQACRRHSEGTIRGLRLVSIMCARPHQSGSKNLAKI
jgi:hypothetical protein